MTNNSSNPSFAHVGRRLALLAIPIILFVLYLIYVSQKTIECTIFYTNDIKGNIVSSEIMQQKEGKGFSAFIYLLKEHSKASLALTKVESSSETVSTRKEEKDETETITVVERFSALASLLDEHEYPFLLIDAGNTIAGSPESDLKKGETVVQLMNMLGYDAMGLGSAEFEWGKDNLIHLSSIASFPFIATNIVDKTTQKPLKYVSPYIIKKVAGIKFGIIAFIAPRTLQSNLDKNIQDIKQLHTFETLRRAVKILREEKQVDTIILLSRFGTESQTDTKNSEKYNTKTDNISIANEIEGIDIIISSDLDFSHELNEAYLVGKYPTIICQTKGNGETVGMLKLVIREKNKKVVTFFNEIISLRNKTIQNPEVEQFLEHIYQKHQNSIIGKTPHTLEKNTVGNMITQIMQNRVKSDIAFLSMRDIKASINPGKISYRHMHKVLPFNDRIVTLSLKGKYIKKLLERYIIYLHSSGIDYHYNKKEPVYDRISQIKVSGKDINDDNLYTLVITERMLNSAIPNNIFREGTNIRITNQRIRDEVIDYIQTHVPLLFLEEKEVQKT